MPHAEFAVIGGGPAGASAARRLAQRGASVILFERQKMPRPKPCGGALSVRAMACLGFGVPASLVDAEVFGARVHFGGASAEARLDRRLAVLVTRSRFDLLLVEKAQACGARVVWADVKSVEARPAEVALATAEGEFTAGCAIVCEGAGRRLARTVRRPDRPSECGFCIEAEVPVARPDPHADLKDVVEIHFGIVGRGYGWLFHHGSYCSIGVGDVCSRFEDPVGTFRRFAAGRGIDASGDRFRGAHVPLGGVRRTLCADRLILAGDAAGWVDPFLGEGLAYAIRSGQLAAETALEASARGDLTRRGFAPYEDRCRREFGRDLELALTLSRVAYRWPGLLIGALAAGEHSLRNYLLVAAGEWTYRRFFRWLLGRAPRVLIESRRCTTTLSRA
jgi:geranylgeranyl reductase family protein